MGTFPTSPCICFDSLQIGFCYRDLRRQLSSTIQSSQVFLKFVLVCGAHAQVALRTDGNQVVERGGSSLAFGHNMSAVKFNLANERVVATRTFGGSDFGAKVRVPHLATQDFGNALFALGSLGLLYRIRRNFRGVCGNFRCAGAHFQFTKLRCSPSRVRGDPRVSFRSLRRCEWACSTIRRCILAGQL